MYECCLETEHILKKQIQKTIEDIWVVKAVNKDEIEKLLKIQVSSYIIYHLITFLNYLS